MNELSNPLTRSRNLLQIQGTISGVSAIFLIDSGASGNFISSNFVKQHRIIVEPPKKRELITLADGTQQTALGIVPAVPIVLSTYRDQINLTQCH